MHAANSLPQLHRVVIIFAAAKLFLFLKMKHLNLLHIFSILLPSVLANSVHSSGSSYFFYEQSVFPRDCKEVLKQCSGGTANGVYFIKPDGCEEGFEVYCDNQTDGGGWTVFQRRTYDNFVDFRRDFSEYREGFGFLSGEFWLGNKILSFLTNQKPYHLRIDMTNSVGLSFYVTYDLFRISGERSNYKLISVGRYNGTAETLISQCPANTIFGPCVCERTCADPDDCQRRCTVNETCICPAGYLLSGTDCVRPEKCSCFDPTFGVIALDDSKFNSNCSEHCTCKEATLTCDRNFQCHANAICEERNNIRKCYCKERFIGDGQSCTPPPVDCYDVFASGSSDGVYTIAPTGWTELPFEVYCNMSHGGGWTVIQRRVNGSVSFDRNWDDYKAGFGSAGANKNVWLGNEILYHITNQKNYKLRIDMIQNDGVRRGMNYNLFRVDNSTGNYRLKLGNYTGNAGFDYMSSHRDQEFSTTNRDNDGYPYDNCADYNDAGWWYAACFTANLNGVYGRNGTRGFTLYNPNTDTNHLLHYTQMKIRPVEGK
ncbi:Fibroleukin [Holothuria leucospilota]|uniref:Fibroleukin n=1 Tax=Holothuria leucospilota TaxID=206669 RepID=A0A9Q1C0B8_HOLLE|nr:Fibroleukin [Holothuria leucospilota]